MHDSDKQSDILASASDLARLLSRVQVFGPVPIAIEAIEKKGKRTIKHPTEMIDVAFTHHGILAFKLKPSAEAALDRIRQHYSESLQGTREAARKSLTAVALESHTEELSLQLESALSSMRTEGPTLRTAKFESNGLILHTVELVSNDCIRFIGPGAYNQAAKFCVQLRSSIAEHRGISIQEVRDALISQIDRAFLCK